MFHHLKLSSFAKHVGQHQRFRWPALVAAASVVFLVSAGNMQGGSQQVPDAALSLLKHFKQIGPFAVDTDRIAYFQDFVNADPPKRANAIAIAFAGVGFGDQTYIVVKDKDADNLRVWIREHISMLTDTQK
jgi:hypothetical protein